MFSYRTPLPTVIILPSGITICLPGVTHLRDGFILLGKHRTQSLKNHITNQPFQRSAHMLSYDGFYTIFLNNLIYRHYHIIFLADSLRGTLRKVINEEQFKYHNESTNMFMRGRDGIKVCNSVNWTEALTIYCEKCSLHGLKYVGDLQLHPLER